MVGFISEVGEKQLWKRMCEISPFETSIKDVFLGTAALGKCAYVIWESRNWTMHACVTFGKSSRIPGVNKSQFWRLNSLEHCKHTHTHTHTHTHSQTKIKLNTWYFGYKWRKHNLVYVSRKVEKENCCKRALPKVIGSDFHEGSEILIPIKNMRTKNSLTFIFN